MAAGRWMWRRCLVFFGGRTVFVGRIVGMEGIVKASECEVWVGSALRSVIRIEGEMLPERAARTGVRSLSTTTPVDISDVLTRRARCRLLCR